MQQCAQAIDAVVKLGSTCGRCAAGSSEGATCSPDPDDGMPCAPGFACDAGVCEKLALGKVGEACAPLSPCAPNLYCDVTCKLLKSVGETCSELLGECDHVQRGLLCDPATKRCAPIPLSKPGEHCYLIGEENGSACSLGAKCSAAKGFLCIGPAQDGEACDPSGSSEVPCIAPAECVGGVCRLPHELSCAGGGIDGGGVTPSDSGKPGPFSVDIPAHKIRVSCPGGTVEGSVYVRYWNFGNSEPESATISSFTLTLDTNDTLPLIVTPDSSGVVPAGEGIQVEHTLTAVAPTFDICSRCTGSMTLDLDVAIASGGTTTHQHGPTPVTCITP